MWCKKLARQEKPCPSVWEERECGVKNVPDKKNVGAHIWFTGKNMDESILIGPGNVNWPGLNGPGPFHML